MTKKEITEIVMDGDTGEYSHLIIYCDHWDYTYGYRYVKHNENINVIINDIKSGGSPGMFSISEVYNYNLDLNKQLNEKRTYHIEPLTKSNREETLQKTQVGEKKQSKISSEETIYISENFKRAVEYAMKMHEGQYRLDGSPYIKHPLGVAKNILKYKKSKNLETLLISAVLHDVLEDTNATYYDIVNLFGPQVASIVLELTTDEDLKKEVGKTRYLEIKMKNMSSWALTIKLCDRLDNVCDLTSCNSKFKNKYIRETIAIIDYLLKNRKLNNTQINIIKDITDTLILLSQLSNQPDYYNNLLHINTNIRSRTKKEQISHS